MTSSVPASRRTEEPRSGPPTESVSDAMVRGASWTLLLHVADRTIGMISTVLLARLLVPADFGLVALATSLVALLGLLGAFGLELALIQTRTADRLRCDTVWTFRVLFGLALATALVLLAGPTAGFYDEPRLVHVIFGLALARAIQGFQNVGITLLDKHMAFDRAFRFGLCVRVGTTFLATIPLALAWRNYWALVGGTIAGSCIQVALSYAMHPYRPRLSLAAWRELLRFSKWVQAANVVGFIAARSAHFILAMLAGVPALGTYTMARQVANVSSTEFAAAVHRAVFPGYARLSGDVALLRRAYLRVMSVLALVTLPAATGLALLARPVVQVFLGDKWHDVIPLLPLFAVYGVASVFVASTAHVYLALGTPRRYTALVGVQAAVFVPIMLCLVSAMGAQGAALALLAGSLVASLLNLRMLFAAIEVAPRDLARITWRPTLGTLVMAVVVALSQRYWTPGGALAASAVTLVSVAVIGAAAYGGTLLLSWRLAARPDGAESFVLERLHAVTIALRGRGALRSGR